MSGSSKVTTDHETIRRWAEERGGRPARVKGTGGQEGGDDVGLLRFDFGEPDESLEPISWEEFFREFENEKLAMVYQDTTREGQESRFFKFVRRDDA